MGFASLNPSYALRTSTVRGKARPTDLRTLRCRDLAAPARTVQSESRSATGHRPAHQEAGRALLPLPLRTAETASSASHRGQARAPRAACFAPLDRSTNRPNACCFPKLRLLQGRG